MARKTLQTEVEWKAGRDAGELEGYASVFNNVDKVGDVVMPGAFRKTIEDWKRSSQPMPLIADHELSTEGLVGSIVSLSEDAHGLRFKAKLSSKAKAQDLRTDILEGHVRGTSFTYEVIRQKAGERAGQKINELHEVRLYEITVSPFPINELAGITNAKTTQARVNDAAAAFERWVESMTHALAIGDVAARKAATDLLVADYPATVQPPSVADDNDGSVTTDDAGPEGGSTSSSKGGAAYAQSFLHGPHDDAPDERPSKSAPPEVLAQWEHERSNKEIAEALAEIEALGGQQP